MTTGAARRQGNTTFTLPGPRTPPPESADYGEPAGPVQHGEGSGRPKLSTRTEQTHRQGIMEESALDLEGCRRASSPIVFAPPAGKRIQREKATSYSFQPVRGRARSHTPSQAPGAICFRLNCTTGCWALGGAGVTSTAEPTNRWAFSFHMEGPQRIMPQDSCIRPEAETPAVHSRRSFAYHRLTDSTWPPHPTHLPTPNGKTVGPEAV